MPITNGMAFSAVNFKTVHTKRYAHVLGVHVSAATIATFAAIVAILSLLQFGRAPTVQADNTIPTPILVGVYEPVSAPKTDPEAITISNPVKNPEPKSVPFGVLPTLPPDPVPLDAPIDPNTGAPNVVLPYTPLKLDSSGCPVEAPADTMRSGSDAIGVNQLCRDSVAGARSKEAAQAIMYAFSRLGTPYSQPGRTSVGYFDCSSLIARAYFEGAKVNPFFSGMPFTGSYANENSWAGVLVKTADHRPGDIRIMWRPGTTMAGSAGNNGHAQMYLAHGYVIQSGGGGGGDSRVNVSDDSSWGWPYQNFAYTGK